MEDLVLKEIEGFPGYRAGSDGNIYSYIKKGSSVDYTRIPRKLKPGLDGLKKYFHVSLRKNNKTYVKNVHKIICEAFNGKSDGNCDASHLDGNSKNNLPENLIWETHSSNQHRRKNHGTDDIGIKNKRALFDLQEIRQIRKWLADGITSREISKIMKCNERDIGKIKRGERYMGQGFV